MHVSTRPPRNTLGLVLLGVLAALLAVPSPHAEAAQGFFNSRIADAGLAEVGTRRATGWDQPGECVKSVQRWVAAAGGTFKGGGSVSGYTNSGADPIPISGASRGDVIQYTPNSGDGWDTGVHTVVVTANLGNGRFSIVQSNAAGYVNGTWVASNYAGLVTTNPNWAPTPPKGFTARAWRFGSTQPAVVDPAWAVQTGTSASDVAFARIANGWEMFHIGGNNTIFRKTSGQSSWSAISGPRAKRIAAATSTDGRVELFYIGMNDQVYHHWENSPGGNISSWESLGGGAKEIAAARSGSNWEVFVVGGDNAIYRATQQNHSWQRMNGTYAYDVAAATSRDGRVELFHIAGGRNVMHAWQSSPGSGFGGWVDMGGWTTSIGASSVGNGEFEIFAIGSGATIWRIAPWSGFDRWQQLAGGASQVAAAMNPDGRVEILVVGGNGQLYHAWQKSLGWF